MITDLKEALNLYEQLIYNDSLEGEEDELGYGKGVEDLRKWKQHRRLERNRKLAEQAKKIHGYRCQICHFDFQKVYGAIGKGFIEAHHLRSLSENIGKILELDPKKDFAVLCSNCHRMIHRTKDPGDLSGFRILLQSP